MSKKEKLVEEWWLANSTLNLVGEGSFSQTEAFIAGFEKAKAMVLEIISNGDGDPTGYIYSCVQLMDL